MAEFKWDLEPDGTISYFPYVASQTATLTEKFRLVRLEYVSSPEQPDEKAHALQLALSRDQVRELGESLLRLAEAPHIPCPPSEARH